MLYVRYVLGKDNNSTHSNCLQRMPFSKIFFGISRPVMIYISPCPSFISLLVHAFRVNSYYVNVRPSALLDNFFISSST